MGLIDSMAATVLSLQTSTLLKLMVGVPDWTKITIAGCPAAFVENLPLTFIVVPAENVPQISSGLSETLVQSSQWMFISFAPDR